MCFIILFYNKIDLSKVYIYVYTMYLYFGLDLVLEKILYFLKKKPSATPPGLGGHAPSYRIPA